jgi:hypothetical protein
MNGIFTIMEEWIMCEFDDRYFISNFGNIKRILANGDERDLKPSILNKGKTHPYYYIQMCKKGKRTNYLIHRLVALAFCEGHSDINNVCDHIDRNTFNNHYTNLRWCTQKDNTHNSSTYKSEYPEENHKYYVDKAAHQKIKNSKKYYCELCNVKCTSPNHLKVHLDSHRHQLRTQAKEELADLYNEFNYKIWRNNRYPKRGKRPYLTHP